MHEFQTAALQRELKDASHYIDTGRQLMAKISPTNEFYVGALLMYSYGFERLLKIVLVLYRREARGKMPGPEELKEWNHGLAELTRKVVSECYEDDFKLTNEVVRATAAEDRRFLNNDKLLARFIDVLDAFANRERYHYLDTLVGGSPGTPPWKLMEDLENAIAKADGFEGTQESAIGEDAYYGKVTAALNILAERFHRAIAKLFVWGILGDEGKRQAAVGLQGVALNGWPPK